ncbi:MAG: hypothetical protein GX254_10280 [Clostridiales bacterium]|jgi:hypothetical protein|nr:hypothetical protein [Clostridiales bacterium]
MISRIKIDQQFAQIGIKITPAKLNIKMPKQKMKIVQEDPQMEINIERPTFEINMKKVRNEMGFRDPMTLMREIRNTAIDKTYNYISQTVNDGNQMAKVEQKGNRIAGVYRSKSLKQSQKGINIGLMPKELPEIVWSKGSIDIKWTSRKFKIEWEGECRPEIIVDPKHSVEVYLREKPYIKIIIEDAEAQESNGRLIDAKL